jgi:hypothetical protein
MAGELTHNQWNGNANGGATGNIQRQLIAFYMS